MLVLFSKTITFLLKKKTNLITAEEELVYVDIDGIGNVEDLHRLVLIDEECENCNVVADGGELTRNINKKKKPVVSLAYISSLCDKC